MTKGRELDVWCEEAVSSWAGQRYHLRKLLIYWQVSHVLESNPTRLPVVSRDCSLNHGQEDEFVVIFTFDDTTNKPHPH